jgi:hypothetical protein
MRKNQLFWLLIMYKCILKWFKDKETVKLFSYRDIKRSRYKILQQFIHNIKIKDVLIRIKMNL